MALSAVYSYKLRRVLSMVDEVNARLKLPLSDEEMMIELEQYMLLQKAKMELSNQLSYVIL